MSDILNQWRELSTQRFIPMQASLELTHRCNESCEHCYLDELKDDKLRLLTLDQWVHILEELKSAGVLYLIFIGGEAMLSPVFWPLANKAHELGFDLSLITNGLKIQNGEVAKKLKQTGFRHLTFSLYSLEPGIHDELTNKQGSFLKTTKAIELSQAAGLEVGVNCLLTYKNIDQYFELADWCIERNIEVKADPNITPKFSGDLTPTRLRASKAQLTQYYLRAAQKWERGSPQAQAYQSDDYICNAAKGKCAVTPYGDLLSCLEIRKPLGSLKTESFADAWQSEEAQKWRSIKMSDIEGLDKTEGKSYCDHCPGMADHEHGNHLVASEFSKELAKIKREVKNYVSRNQNKVDGDKYVSTII